MDIGRVQPAATGIDTSSVAHGVTQPGNETAASQRQLIQAVKAVNGAELFGQDSELTFVFDRQAHKMLVRVLNKRTREVVMQIPAEDVLRMAQEGKGL
jgi:uncharacterized FlaG/YvyC family protein